jgi:hypothetical protein
MYLAVRVVFELYLCSKMPGCNIFACEENCIKTNVNQQFVGEHIWQMWHI